MPTLKAITSSEERSRRRKGQPAKSKRSRTRGPYHKACAPCARAKRQCDGQRPCSRCVQRGQPHLCVDSVDRRSKGSRESTEKPKHRNEISVVMPPKQRSSDPDLVLAPPVPGYPNPPPGGGIWGLQTGAAPGDPVAHSAPNSEPGPSAGGPGSLHRRLVGRKSSGPSPVSRAVMSTESDGRPFGAPGTGPGPSLPPEGDWGSGRGVRRVSGGRAALLGRQRGAMAGTGGGNLYERGPAASASMSDSASGLGQGGEAALGSSASSGFGAGPRGQLGLSGSLGGSATSLGASAQDGDLFGESAPVPGVGRPPAPRPAAVAGAGAASHRPAQPSMPMGQGMGMGMRLVGGGAPHPGGADPSGQQQPAGHSSVGRFDSGQLPSLRVPPSSTAAHTGGSPPGMDNPQHRGGAPPSVLTAWPESPSRRPPATYTVGVVRGVHPQDTQMPLGSPIVTSDGAIDAKGGGASSRPQGSASALASAGRGLLVRHFSSSSEYPSSLASGPLSDRERAAARAAAPGLAQAKAGMGGSNESISFPKTDDDETASHRLRHRISSVSDVGSLPSQRPLRSSSTAHASGTTADPRDSAMTSGSRKYSSSADAAGGYRQPKQAPATAQLMDERGQVRFSLPLQRPHRRKPVEDFVGVEIDECGGLRIQLSDFRGAVAPAQNTASGTGFSSVGENSSNEVAQVLGPTGVRALVGPESHFGLAVPPGIEKEIDASIGRVGDLPTGPSCWMPEDDAACAALACSDVPSIHYVHDGRYLQPGYVWYSPSALQFLRMNRDRLRWLLGAIKGGVTGKPRKHKSRSRSGGRSRVSSSLAPFVWLHPDDVPAHSAAVLRQHLVRHEESRSMARVMVFGPPDEPDYGSGASVRTGTTGTTATGMHRGSSVIGGSTAGGRTAAKGARKETPLPGPAASDHPLDNLVGKAFPCAWVTRLHWHGVCPRAMTVVMHPLPRDGWHMRAFYNMPRGLSTRQQRLLASQLRQAMTCGVLQSTEGEEEDEAVRAGLAASRPAGPQNSVVQGPGLRRYGTSQTIASSFIGRHGLRRMGTSAESRGGSVVATPRMGASDEGEMLPPMGKDRGMSSVRTPRIDGFDGSQEAPGLMEMQSSGGRLQRQPRSTDRGIADAYQSISEADEEEEQDDDFGSGKLRSVSAEESESFMHSGASRASDSGQTEQTGQAGTSSRWQQHDVLSAGATGQHKQQAPSPIVSIRRLGDSRPVVSGGGRNHPVPKVPKVPKVPPLRMRSDRTGSNPFVSGTSVNLSMDSDTFAGALGSAGKGSTAGDTDRQDSSRIHEGPKAALTRSMRPKQVSRQMSGGSAVSASSFGEGAYGAPTPWGHQGGAPPSPEVLRPDDVLDGMSGTGGGFEPATRVGSASGSTVGTRLHSFGSTTSREAGGISGSGLRSGSGPGFHGGIGGARLGAIRGKYSSDVSSGHRLKLSPGIRPMQSGREKLQPLQEGVRYHGSGEEREEAGSAEEDAEEQRRPSRGGKRPSPGSEHSQPRSRLHEHPDRRAGDDRHSGSSNGSSGNNRYRRMMLRPGEGESSRPMSLSRLSADPTGGIEEPPLASKPRQPTRGESNGSLGLDRLDSGVLDEDGSPRRQPGQAPMGVSDPFESSHRSQKWASRMSSARSEISLQSSVLPRKKGRFGARGGRDSGKDMSQELVPFGSSAAMLDDPLGGLGMGALSQESGESTGTPAAGMPLTTHDPTTGVGSPPFLAASRRGSQQTYGFIGAGGKAAEVSSIDAKGDEMADVAPGSQGSSAKRGAGSRGMTQGHSHSPQRQFSIDPLDGGRDPRQMSLRGPYGLRLLQLAMREVSQAVSSDGELSSAMHRVVGIGDSMWPVLDAVGITTGRGVEGQHLVSTGSAQTPSMAMVNGSDARDDFRRSAGPGPGSVSSRMNLSFDQQSTSTAGRQSLRGHAAAGQQSSAVSALAFPALFRAARTIAMALQNPDQVREHPQRQMLVSILPATTLAPATSATQPSASEARSGSSDQIIWARGGRGILAAARAAKSGEQGSPAIGGKRTRQERRELAAGSSSGGTGMPPPDAMVQSAAPTAPMPKLDAELPFSIQVALEPSPVPVGLEARANSSQVLARSFEVAEMLVGAASRAMQIQAAYELTMNPFDGSYRGGIGPAQGGGEGSQGSGGHGRIEQ